MIEASDAERATAIIVNGPQLWITKEDLQFTGPEFEFQVRPFSHTESLFRERGHAHTPPKLTHYVLLSRKDGAGFNPKSAFKAAGALVSFLGFVKGTRVGFGHTEGTTASGEPAFRCIGFTKSDRFRAGSNWFHFSLTRELPGLFENYVQRVEPQSSRRTLGRALQYYKAGNFTQVDATEVALIMSAAGLETMAHHILTTNSGWASDLFQRATLEDKLRACAYSLGITSDPAEHSSALAARLAGKTAKSGKISDGFTLLAEFRNGLTHPGDFRYSTDEFMDPWFSSQWLLEVMILAFLGYKGNYQDRRKRSGYAGANDPLPVR